MSCNTREVRLTPLTPLTRRLDPRPEFLHSVAGLGGDGQHLVQLQALLQRQQVARALVAAEPVDLGGRHGKLAPGGAQPVDQLPVALLRGHIRVHQADAQLERRADRQVRLDEGRPARRNGLGNLGVAVAGQVGKDQLPPLALVQQAQRS